MKARLSSSLPILAVSAALLSAALAGCSPENARQVVVYTSVDSTEAQAVLDAFEKETGVEVLPLFDTEASKTTGLALRLLSETDRPQADVFWNNELSRTIMLAQRGAFEAYASPSAADIPSQWKDENGRWASFSLRARVIVYNPGLVAPAEAPRTLEDLCDPRWKGKVGIANPLFGTTASHTAALAVLLGQEKAAAYFERLKANGVRVFEGNSVVRDAAASGEIVAGLTDTDDVLLGMERGMKIDMKVPDQGAQDGGTLVIPNSVALVKGAPHPEEGRALVDFLLSKSVEDRFARPEAGQIPVRGEGESMRFDLASMKALEPDWQAVSDLTEPFSRRVADILLE